MLTEDQDPGDDREGKSDEADEGGCPGETELVVLKYLNEISGLGLNHKNNKKDSPWATQRMGTRHQVRFEEAIETPGQMKSIGCKRPPSSCKWQGR